MAAPAAPEEPVAAVITPQPTPERGSVELLFSIFNNCVLYNCPLNKQTKS